MKRKLLTILLILIAPSRTSFEQYLKYAAIYEEGSGAKEKEMPNYNVFPVHAEEDDTKGFEEWGGKDASYDYTPYLTYEIAVKFLQYDTSGETLQSTETRTFLYGMDAHYVKATATTEWARFDEKYDNNAPVWFGRIKDNGDNKIVQQINTLSTEVAWSVAADGWYYNKNATLPAGDWYFGNSQCVTELTAEERMAEFTKFIGGWNGGQVSGNDIQNLVQVHYQNVYEHTYEDVLAITKTGQEEKNADQLRKPVDEYTQDGEYYYTEEFGKQTRWSRWYYDEEYNDYDGAIVQRFLTMPFSITLKSKAEERESRIDFDVPTFQNIGEITYGEDTIKAAPEDARDESWDVPMLTVTFDYNGFPASRIFENFKSSAMKVDYTAWRRYYHDKEWRWDVDSGSAEWTKDDWDKMKYSINDEYVPYDAGYYKITLSFESGESGGYTYYWSGIYNGMRVDANADSKTTFTFILNIQPRKVPLSNVYSMQYSGLGFSLFEDNPYIDVVKYSQVLHSGEKVSGTYVNYTADGLPYGVGRYRIKLKLHDPKYPNPNDGSWSENINRYTPNLEWEGAKGYENNYEYTQYYENNEIVNRFIHDEGVELFILDGDTEVAWGMLYEGSDRDQYLTFTESLAAFGSEVVTYTYTGAPISLEEVFGGVFSSSSIEYTIERNGKSVSEIKDAGTYQVSITPAEGYVWWRGIPFVEEKSQFHILSWSLDEFWEEQGGYEGNEHATLTFEVFVDKRIVTIPRDSYVPKGSEPPFEFEVPIGGDYEVMGYHEHDFGPEGTIPKAGENSAWSKVIYEEGVYDVLIRLTDPANTTWSSGAGEAHGDNFYIVARLYAGFDREKEYPTFIEDLGNTEGNHSSDKWVTLTHTYDAAAYGIDGLFNEADARPTDQESTYTIYQLSQEPSSVDEFWLLGEEVETIRDAGYYGIAVILNDPFLYQGTTETEAYYLVHVEKAKLQATFELGNSARNGGNAIYDGSDRLTAFNTDNSILSFATAAGDAVALVGGTDYNVVVSTPVSAAEMIDAGTYTLQVELSAEIAKNYVLTNGETQYVIDPRPLNLSLGTITGHTYLDTPSKNWYSAETLTYEGITEGAVVEGDELQLSYQFERGGETFSSLDAFSEAGDYTVKVICGNRNYEVTLAETHYIVSPLTLTLNNIAGVTYDGEEHKPNISFTGEKMVLVEDTDYELTYAPDTASGAQLGTTGLPLTAGSYSVTVKLLSKNYTFAGNNDSATATFTIGKVTLSTPYLSTAFFQFTGSDVSEGVKEALGNYDPKTMTVAFCEKNDGTGDLSEVTEAGTYYVKVTLNDANYEWKDGTEIYLEFRVVKGSTPTVTITATDVEVTYGEAMQYPTVSGDPAGYAVSYFYTYKGINDTQYPSSPEAPVNVGTYEITVTALYEDGLNQESFMATATATLTIKARTIGMENIASVSYSGTECKPNISFTGLPESRVLTEGADYRVSYTANAGAQLGTADLPLTAGSYIVTVTLLSKNYTFEGGQDSKTLTFTIEKATLPKPHLSTASFQYTGKDVREGVTNALVGYDPNTMTAAFYENNDGTGDLTEVKAAGTYYVKVSLKDANYKWEDETDPYLMFTVSRSAYDMAGVTFESKTFTYDGQKHNLSVEGLPDGVSVEYSTNEFVDAGTYTVTATFKIQDGGTQYEVPQPMTATLTITAASIVIEWEDRSYTYTGSELTMPNAKAKGVGNDGEITLHVTLKTSAGGMFRDANDYIFEATFESDFAKSGNYILLGAERKYSVAKATLPAPVLGKTFTYTGTNLKADIENAFGYDSALMSVSFYADAETSGNALNEIVGAGTYYAKFTLTDTDNYTWGQTEDMVVPITVAKRIVTPTLTAADVDATYGDTGTALRPTVSGIPAGYDVSYLYTYEGTDGTEYALSSVAPVNVGTYTVTVTAVYAGGANDEPFKVKATAKLTIKALTIGVKDPASVSYNGTERKPDISFTGLPENIMLFEGTDYTVSCTAEADAQLGTAKLPLTAGSYIVTVTLLSGNYTFEGGKNSAAVTFTVEKTMLPKPYLSSASLSYTGEDLMAAVRAMLINDSESAMKIAFCKTNGGEALTEVKNAGDYFLKVTLTDLSYQWEGGETEVYLPFTVTKKAVPKPSGDDTPFVYTGAEQVYAVADDPAYTVSGNRQTNANEAGYKVTVSLNDKANYEWSGGGEDDVIFLFKIQKANYDMSDVRFTDQTVNFDGKEHSIFVEGDLPAGVSAIYQGNGQSSVGGYHVTVSFEGDAENYNPIPSMHALLTIRYAEFDFDKITFENASVKYDGNAHSVYLKGELPEGVEVVYEGNEQRDPGVYTVKAILSDVRGVILEKTATLTVLRTHMEFVDPNGAVTVIVDSADGFDPTWELVCDSVPESIARAAWAWEKDSFTANFTLKFEKDGVEVPFDGKMTVRLVIPQMLRDKAFSMQSMSRSASVEYTRDGDYVVFEADGLSAYVFTCEFIPYLSILQIASVIALVSVAIMIALAIVIKKNKRGE